MKKHYLACMLTFVAGAAMAQSATQQKWPSLYISAAIGQSRMGLACENADQCDKTDVGYKVLVGVPLHPIVALEAAHVDFGKVSLRYGTPPLAGVDASYKASGWLVGVALRHEFHPQLHGVLRAGAAFMTARRTGSPAVLVPSLEDTSTKPYLGLGLEFHLSQQVSITGAMDFTRAYLKEEDGAATSPVRLFSLGLQYAL